MVNSRNHFSSRTWQEIGKNAVTAPHIMLTHNHLASPSRMAPSFPSIPEVPGDRAGCCLLASFAPHPSCPPTHSVPTGKHHQDARSNHVCSQARLQHFLNALHPSHAHGRTWQSTCDAIHISQYLPLGSARGTSSPSSSSSQTTTTRWHHRTLCEQTHVPSAAPRARSANCSRFSASVPGSQIDFADR